jgi:SpoVK/Ycf46/Vps4 family AAA+-type ATPase
MTLYSNREKDWLVAEKYPALADRLPVGTYMVHFTLQDGYFLTEIDDFTLPAKTYGNEINRSERIISTFLDRPSATGVILAGEKGAGKTLLAKKISIELAQKHQIPTLVVNQAHTGDGFNQFLQSITQPVMVIFDEFEKVYEEDQQAALLTVLDGTMSSKKLYIVAVNDIWSLNKYLLNRPGRFYYLFSYNGLSESAVRAFLKDNLNNHSRLESVAIYTQMFRNFTFDMLSAIVEEMNRYDEPLSEVLEVLNVSMKFSDGDIYQICDVRMKPSYDQKRTWDADSTAKDSDALDFNNGRPFNPLTEKVTQLVRYTTEDDGVEMKDCEYFTVTPDDIVSYDQGGFFTFETDDIIIKIGKKPAPQPERLTIPLV